MEEGDRGAAAHAVALGELVEADAVLRLAVAAGQFARQERQHAEDLSAKPSRKAAYRHQANLARTHERAASRSTMISIGGGSPN
jgi:hypothetical protein